MVKIFELWVKGNVFFFVDNLTIEQKKILISHSKEYFSKELSLDRSEIEKYIQNVYAIYKIALEQVEISDVLTIK